MLYQQLDYPLLRVMYSIYEGRVSKLYRIGEDRIRVEKKKRGGKEEKREKERTRERKRVRETLVRHDCRSTLDTSYELHCCCYRYHY